MKSFLITVLLVYLIPSHSQIEIHVDSNNVILNKDTLQFPLKISQLNKVIGTTKMKELSPALRVQSWKEAGIHATYQDTDFGWRSAIDIDFIGKKGKKNFFNGVFSINANVISPNSSRDDLRKLGFKQEEIIDFFYGLYFRHIYLIAAFEEDHLVNITIYSVK